MTHDSYKAAKMELIRIAEQLRALAPELRGTGPYASDASYNRVLRHADELEKIGRS